MKNFALWWRGAVGFLLRRSTLKLVFLLGCLVVSVCRADESSNDTPSTPGAASISELLSESSQLLEDGNLDQALDKANAAVELDPKHAATYELRGSIYIQEKLWDRAERNVMMAQKLDPADSAFKYQLAEIKFLRKSYEDAEPRFAALRNDPTLGDLATYNMFLCELLAGDEDRARKDLNALNKIAANPSYYFANAAWSLAHGDKAAADKWFASAQNLYDAGLTNRYMVSLIQAERVTPAIVTFTTTDGQEFTGAHAFVEQGGLRISTNDGWVSIPYSRLPEDFSSFPPEVRNEIADNRRNLGSREAGEDLISFTTKSGTKYEKVRWAVEKTGVRVLTSNGWALVPYNQLEDDISRLPAKIQKAAVEQRAAATPISGPQLVTFSTRQGKHFDEVQAGMSSSGLRVLTSDGWTTIPFAQLPEDLTMFPEGWQVAIKRRLAARAGSSEDQEVSFTDKKGIRYDSVRAFPGASGLHVLTTNGWTCVPFGDLPEDISAFPESWREELLANRMKPLPNSKPTLAPDKGP